MADTLTATALLAEIRLAESLGCREFGGPLSAAEERALAAAGEQSAPDPNLVEQIRTQIRSGADPLGQRYCGIRAAPERRRTGTFFTPPEIVAPMVEWVLTDRPDQVVDAGAGTGRFAAAVLRRTRNVPVIAVERDPVLALLCRAHLAVIGGKVLVRNADFLTTQIPSRGRRAFIGNPPYVRHHDLDPAVKEWASHASGRLGRRCSKLAGLHVHFFLATALRARAGDVGCFVTSAEWLDVGYGDFLRWLLLERLGLRSLHLLHVSETPFADAMTTALITCFQTGSPPDRVLVQVARKSSNFADLGVNGRAVDRQRLATARRWGPIMAGSPERNGRDGVPLHTIARVHRGVATGANRFFVLTPIEAARLGVKAFCRPCITSAKEVIAARNCVRRSSTTRLLLCIPGELPWEDFPPALRDYLQVGVRAGVAERYLCRNRSPWWSVGPTRPPPVVMTYMGRRPPVFARNPDGLVLLNVAHGIYPREPWPERALDRLVEFLNREGPRFRGQGRVYHGGMEKFEPKEVEALLVPARNFFGG